MFYTHCLHKDPHTFASRGLGNLRPATLHNKMLAHKHERGIGTLVRAPLFMALIVILAQSRLKEYPKRERKKKKETIKLIKHTCTYCCSVQGMLESLNLIPRKREETNEI